MPSGFELLNQVAQAAEQADKEKKAKQQPEKSPYQRAMEQSPGLDSPALQSMRDREAQDQAPASCESCGQPMPEPTPEVQAPQGGNPAGAAVANSIVNNTGKKTFGIK